MRWAHDRKQRTVTARWAWWVARDDGQLAAGPFPTKASAEARWRAVFDTSEYRVELRYNDTQLAASPRPDPELLAQLLLLRERASRPTQGRSTTEAAEGKAE